MVPVECYVCGPSRSRSPSPSRMLDGGAKQTYGVCVPFLGAKRPSSSVAGPWECFGRQHGDSAW
eukprot:3666436-Prorocentrum_lima.AAC.1